MTKQTFEVGCYGDGVLGHQHTRERCAELLHDIATGKHSASDPLAIFQTGCLSEALWSPMSDDASEEYEACDWLNKHMSIEGAVWGWRDGDFGLWPDSEGE